MEEYICWEKKSSKSPIHLFVISEWVLFFPSDNDTSAQSQREGAGPRLIQGFANVNINLSVQYSTCIPDACSDLELMVCIGIYVCWYITCLWVQCAEFDVTAN